MAAKVKPPEDKARDKTISDMGDIAAELTVNRVREWLEIGAKVDTFVHDKAVEMGYDDIGEFIEDAVDFYARNYQKYGELLERLDECEFEKSVYKAIARPEIKRKELMDELVNLSMMWRILELPDEAIKVVLDKLLEEVNKIGRKEGSDKELGTKDRVKSGTDKLPVKQGKGEV